MKTVISSIFIIAATLTFCVIEKVKKKKLLKYANVTNLIKIGIHV